jgi:hypothetical protein
MQAVLEDIPMSHEEIQEIHRKLDDLTDAMHEMAKANVQLATQFGLACKTLEEHGKIIQRHQDDITAMKGKVGVGQWVLVTVGGALIACLVGGIWTIAAKV